ncbi:MAG TPA: hypothetical protein PLR38_02405 [Syntrophorhabdaceae bacterium]|nr:hypothetical protein [Syntrophorhabdaceae bacterium]HOL04584.1 hypothetical protein [Syntrophorhabdaceae bacterium]HPP41360.1 hypothetical protein [Syntrophorhabdaceae bacterium]
MKRPMEFLSSINSFFDSCRKTLSEFFYGMTLFELEKELVKEKGHLNNLLLLIVFGDLVGLPIFPPYYSMRLLPYIIPHMDKWKRGLLREKDLTDIVSGDL